MSALKAGNYPDFLNQCTCEELNKPWPRSRSYTTQHLLGGYKARILM